MSLILKTVVASKAKFRALNNLWPRMERLFDHTYVTTSARCLKLKASSIQATRRRLRSLLLGETVSRCLSVRGGVMKERLKSGSSKGGCLARFERCVATPPSNSSECDGNATTVPTSLWLSIHPASSPMQFIFNSATEKASAR